MTTIQESEIQLSTGAKFKIVHNLPDFKLDINHALESWLARTDKYTPESFCEYIKSKDPINIIALTGEEFEKIKTET